MRRQRDEDGRLLPPPWDGNPETAPDPYTCHDCELVNSLETAALEDWTHEANDPGPVPEGDPF